MREHSRIYFITFIQLGHEFYFPVRLNSQKVYQPLSEKDSLLIFFFVVIYF